MHFSTLLVTWLFASVTSFFKPDSLLVQGRIMSWDSLPVSGVTIHLPTTSQWFVTNETGYYILRVPKQAFPMPVVVQYAGLPDHIFIQPWGNIKAQIVLQKPIKLRRRLRHSYLRGKPFKKNVRLSSDQPHHA